MHRRRRSGEQFNLNWLALLGLLIALFGLGYNTYRNETTESQRNTRQAAFLALEALGELQQLADTRFFGNDTSEINRIAIWGKVIVIRDFTTLVSPAAQQGGRSLFEIWSTQAEAFDAGDRDAERQLADAIRELRSTVMEDIRRLR
ncbi:MAG: hypothetical protein ACNA7W_05490 [Pseudomonadales bacterium]